MQDNSKLILIIDPNSKHYKQILKVSRHCWGKFTPDRYLWKVENINEWFWEEEFIADAGIKYIEISSKLKNFV